MRHPSHVFMDSARFEDRAKYDQDLLSLTCIAVDVSKQGLLNEAIKRYPILKYLDPNTRYEIMFDAATLQPLVQKRSLNTGVKPQRFIDPRLQNI